MSIDSTGERPQLVSTPDGLELQYGALRFHGDFSRMLKRIAPGKLQRELLVRAARVKNADVPLRAVDATAGLGEDSFLLAAAGFEVLLFERDPDIAALLEDALARARNLPQLAPIVARMTLKQADSVQEMPLLEEPPDVVLLDPMFPTRQKDARVKKKLQLLQMLEQPCEDEEALLDAALAARPRKVVVKRPAKGPCLAERKPSYALEGKAIRYDCYALSR